METVEFKVKKMGCQACVVKVTAALRSVRGVEVIDVKPGRAVVRFDPATAGEREIVTAVNAAGYEASREVRDGNVNSNAGSAGPR